MDDERKEEYGKCRICNKYNTNREWCQTCDPKLLTQGWTSGNETIDELIKSTQLKATKHDNYLRWIPYNELKIIEGIGEGGFATICKATWINNNKSSICQTQDVALKRLKDSQNISDEFLNEFKNYLKFCNKYNIIHIYGLTQDPITKEFIFVMQYINNGSLHNFLTKEFKNLKWKDKIGILLDIIIGLTDIHKEKIIHHDLHSGNILQSHVSVIADLGLSTPANQTSTSNRKGVFGVLPYVAPEVLSGEPYTMASDIYSFGVLMSMVSTGKQPFYNIAHDSSLAISICKGLRPAFSINTPTFYIELAYKCMDADPVNRPTAREIQDIITLWIHSFDNENYLRVSLEYSDKEIDEMKSIEKEFLEMDKVEFYPSTITETIHPDAVYTSRLLEFTNLPQPTKSNTVMIIGNNNDSNQTSLSL